MVAGEKFCHGDWSNIKKKYSSFDEGELLLFCFSSAYIIALLHDTLKMPLDHKRWNNLLYSFILHFKPEYLHEFCFRIDVVNQIHGVPVDWALGAFIVQTALNRTEYSDSSVSYLNSYDSSGLSPLLLITAAVVFTAFSILRWRRPQLKTIYDMERGRYIITRVSRWASPVGAGDGWTFCSGAPATVYVDFRKFTCLPAGQPCIAARPCRINRMEF
jgi:apyrase